MDSWALLVLHMSGNKEESTGDTELRGTARRRSWTGLHWLKSSTGAQTRVQTDDTKTGQATFFILTEEHVLKLPKG